MASPTDLVKINLNQNLWGLIVGFSSLGASEYFALSTLYWFSAFTSAIMLCSIALTTTFYTWKYCESSSLKFPSWIGWRRLGVVLSFAWLIGAFAYVTIDLIDLRTEFSRTVNFTDPDDVQSKTVNIQIAGEIRTYSECSATKKEISCSPRWENAGVLVLAPIAIAWILVALLVFSVGWIRAGFRKGGT